MKSNRISGGIYLVIDPSMKESELFEKLEQALQEKISAVQIWDHWITVINKEKIIEELCELCHQYGVPVLINNGWELLNSLPLDGVHFDSIPSNYGQIQQEIEKDFICGLTCNNDLKEVKWAVENQLNYISFCSVFPSSTSNSCELVSFHTIKEARKLTSIPIFLAGGIQVTNINELKELDYDGVAIVSGIMNADNPAYATQQYLENLKK